jgi:hypothetical protein
MTVLRIDIERALDEVISNEDGMRFQGLAVVLAKEKWPGLIAFAVSFLPCKSGHGGEPPRLLCRNLGRKHDTSGQRSMINL